MPAVAHSPAACDWLPHTMQVELDANNATTGSGGAIAVDGATDRFNMTGCIFNANAAATAGGAVALSGFAANATTTITKADFEVRRNAMLIGSPKLRAALVDLSVQLWCNAHLYTHKLAQHPDKETNLGGD